MSPLDVVPRYAVSLRLRGLAQKHIQTTLARITFMLEGVGDIHSVTPALVRDRLLHLASYGCGKPSVRVRGQTRIAGLASGASAKTVNDYRAALHGLFSWLVREGIAPVNPVAVVERRRMGDPTVTRRSLSTDEVERLLASSGPRADAYLFAVTTGLRRSEITSLRWSDLDLLTGVLRVRASMAKNRKATILPLAASCVEMLRARERNGERVFPTLPDISTFRADLRRAGIDPETTDGVLDFHALRVTFGTALARANVPLALTQRLMRHSTPVLTSNIYSKFTINDQRTAVEALNRLSGFPDSNQVIPTHGPPQVETPRGPFTGAEGSLPPGGLVGPLARGAQ